VKRGKTGTALIGVLLILAVACSHTDSGIVPTVGDDVAMPPGLSERVLVLDPQAISGEAVTEILSKCPAPRIILLNGSFSIASMESFARFLVLMGYPEASLRDPATGSYTYSSYRNSRELAGMVAWYYEAEGMRPMVIGHSQGGMASIRILHELAGTFSNRVAVWNPLSKKEEDRDTIVDPLTGQERPVLGLTLGFASAAATGKPMRVLLGQWGMLSRLREIPDTVEEFNGYHLQGDLLSGTLFGVGAGDSYFPRGSARVRNVILPRECGHIGLPLTEDLARNPEAREWIQKYVPVSDHPGGGLGFEGSHGRNVVFAAEMWYSIRKQWCLELKRWIGAPRKLQAPISKLQIPNKHQ